MAKKLISFKATKQISKPVRVQFKTADGKAVSFKATKKVSKPVKVEFMAQEKNGKK